MKKNLQRFGASVLAAAMVAQSVALPAAAECCFSRKMKKFCI